MTKIPIKEVSVVGYYGDTKVMLPNNEIIHEGDVISPQSLINILKLLGHTVKVNFDIPGFMEENGWMFRLSFNKKNQLCFSIVDNFNKHETILDPLEDEVELWASTWLDEDKQREEMAQAFDKCSAILRSYNKKE